MKTQILMGFFPMKMWRQLFFSKKENTEGKTSPNSATRPTRGEHACEFDQKLAGVDAVMRILCTHSITKEKNITVCLKN